MPWWLLVMLTVALVVVTAWTWTERGRRALLHRTATRYELTAPEGPVAVAVSRRLAARDTAAGFGGLAGLLLGHAVLHSGLTDGVLPEGTAATSALAWLALMFLGGAVGAVGFALVDARARPGEDQVRVARLRTPAVTDVVGRPERLAAVAAPVAAVLAALVATVLLLAGGRPLTQTTVTALVVAGAAPVLLLAVSRASTPLVLRARRPATDPQGLAWDDVLRARSTADLVGLPTTVGLLGVLVACLVLAEAWSGGPQGQAYSVAAAGVALLLMVAAVVLSASPRSSARLLRQRVWTEDARAVTR